MGVKKQLCCADGRKCKRGCLLYKVEILYLIRRVRKVDMAVRSVASLDTLYGCVCCFNGPCSLSSNALHVARICSLLQSWRAGRCTCTAVHFIAHHVVATYICIGTYGMSVPSLYTESTDSVIWLAGSPYAVATRKVPTRFQARAFYGLSKAALRHFHTAGETPRLTLSACAESNSRAMDVITGSIVTLV